MISGDTWIAATQRDLDAAELWLARLKAALEHLRAMKHHHDGIDGGHDSRRYDPTFDGPPPWAIIPRQGSGTSHPGEPGYNPNEPDPNAPSGGGG